MTTNQPASEPEKAGEARPVPPAPVRAASLAQSGTEDALRISNSRFQAAVQAVNGFIWTNDARGQMVGEQPGWAALTGQSFDEYQGYGWAKVVHPDDAQPTLTAWEEAVREQKPFVFEHRVRRQDGAWRRFSTRAVPIFDPDACIREWVGIHTDITDERETAQALIAETEALEVLNRTGASVASELDLERLVQLVTDAGVELTGARFGAFFYNVLNAAGERYMLYTLSGANRSDFERFGMPRPTAVFHPTFAGRTVVRSNDILADERYGKNDPHNGMPRGHLPVRSYLAVPVSSRSGEVLGGLFFGHPEPGRFSPRHERLMVGLAGQAATAIDNARLYQDAQREIAERRRAEDDLRSLTLSLEQQVEARTAERNRIWQMSHDLFAIMGYDGYLKAVNRAWEQTLGFDEATLLARDFSQQVHPDDHPAIGALIERLRAGETVVGFADRLRHADGSWRWISWTLVPAEDVFYAVGRDVTDEKARAEELQQAQDALRQAQKMEAVGQLTGGIAHDFNNLLTGIIGSLDMLQRRIAAGRMNETDRFISAAVTSANRAAALTHRLLAFSRRQPLDPKPVNANRLVTSMEELLRRTIGEAIQLEMVTAGGLWQTKCDPHQLESALLNLAINARDAMPEGGKLTVETCNAHLDNAYVAKTREVRPGQYVCICVSDTGSGMSRDVVEKAFEPFFTTKPTGQGTGLGLSMVYGFARQSDGYAKIYSELGQGTTIKLYLPRFYGEGEADQSEPRLNEESARAEHGEVVLVVEDETAVRDVVVEVLKDLGYHALEAADGPGGLKELERLPRIDLLVTDVGLPGLNGRQLADAARGKRPDLKVLFMTGYAENAAINGGFLEPGMEMITKPFAIDVLTQRIRRLIESSRSVHPPARELRD